MIDYIFLEKYAKDISVLFVEDDKGISKEMELLLNEIFSNIKVTFDGVEALEEYHNYYRLNGQYPDLILTDIQMPNMNGIEMAKEIKKLNPKQNIIFIELIKHIYKENIKKIQIKK